MKNKTTRTIGIIFDTLGNNLAFEQTGIMLLVLGNAERNNPGKMDLAVTQALLNFSMGFMEDTHWNIDTLGDLLAITSKLVKMGTL